MTSMIGRFQRISRLSDGVVSTLDVSVRFEGAVAVLSFSDDLKPGDVDEVGRIGRCAFAVGATSIVMYGGSATADNSPLEDLASELAALCAQRDGYVFVSGADGHLQQVGPAGLSVDPGPPNWPRPASD